MCISKIKIRPEKDIQLAILHYLKSIGCVCGKTKTMGVRYGKVFRYDIWTMRGKCDLEAFKNGVMYGIEVKSGYNKLTPEQEMYRDLFHKPPDRVFILARKLEDVINIIR